MRIFSEEPIIFLKRKVVKQTMQKSKIASLIATGALLLSTATPAFAETIEISGNGSLSVNTANVNETNVTTVSQTNNAVVSNNVSSNANSGGNSANFNTGGDVNVVSGAAKSSTEVTNALNTNNAQIAPCGNCAAGEGDVKITGNGATSFNNANLNSTNTTVAGQSNNAYVANNVASNANSGNNDAGFNTGGNTVVSTGMAQSDAKVTTAANVNSAKIGGAAAGAGASNDVSALISGNGAGSQNLINLNLPSSVVLAQANNAVIANAVASNANSGGNTADFNTGGAVFVVAGPAISTVDVDNLANFNAADLSCGCLASGVDAKIAGNGAGLTFSTINANLANVLGLTQGNLAALDNGVAGNANSGDNGAAFNTGAVTNDPSVVSNVAWSTTEVSNSANWNAAGAGATVNLPGGNSLNLLMDFSVLLAFLHLM